MNSSIDYQIELVNQLVASLNYYSEMLSENMERYNKYVSKLESNGLVKESITTLNDTYLPNTKAQINNLIELIQEQDIQEAKKIISQLEVLKQTANQ